MGHHNCFAQYGTVQALEAAPCFRVEDREPRCIINITSTSGTSGIACVPRELARFFLCEMKVRD